MGRYLMIDIGAGTMDILYYDSGEQIHYKAVVESPVRNLARQIEQTTGSLVVTGGEMGGGPVSAVLEKRARTESVIISRSAAATIHHDPENVANRGFDVVFDNEARAMKHRDYLTHVTLADIQPGRIGQIVLGFGVDLKFDAVAVCAQDHGAAPPGVSHLDFRHNLFQQALKGCPRPHALLYSAREVPREFNRLRTIATDIFGPWTDEVFVMDSGMAAILGASMDYRVLREKPVVVLDIATSHTVGAIMTGTELAGFFEYHTRDISLERLEKLILELAEGSLKHDRVLAEGGHGAYVRKAAGFDNIDRIIVTGPKRRLMEKTRLNITWGAPWGDNMMTGTVGLCEALRRKLNLSPITYL